MLHSPRSLPLATQRFLQVVHRLMAEDGAENKLLGIGDRLAFVELSRNRVVVLLCASGDLAPLQAKVHEILGGGSGMHFDLVMVGGDREARSVVEGAQPRFMMRRIIRAYHLDDAGELWTGRSTRRDSPVAGALEAVAGGAGAADITHEQLAEHVVVPSEDERAAAREHRAFIQRFRSRRPVATWTLLASIAVVFGLQALWGGTELVPTLVRMGANTPAALETEPWRLLSSAFLHAGPWHVLLNGYVLYALGGFVERVLGWPRFVLLYGAAALGGGVASAVLSGAGLSVGASGAIWGLFGAAAALAWRSEGVLPRRLVRPMRRITLVNLIINLSVSFLPQVDIMAHLGGGVVGALLVSTGVLTRGLPPIEPASVEDREAPIVSSRTLVGAAVLTGVLLYGSLVVGWLIERPWTFAAAPSWSTVVLDPGVPVELPDALTSPTREDGRPGESVWYVGDIGRDPLQLAISIRPSVELDGADLADAIEALRVGSFAPPEGAEPMGGRAYPETPGVAWEERFRYPSNLRATFRLVRLAHAEVFVETVWWHDAPSPWPDEVVERVLESIRVSEITGS